MKAVLLFMLAYCILQCTSSVLHEKPLTISVCPRSLKLNLPGRDLARNGLTVVVQSDADSAIAGCLHNWVVAADATAFLTKKVDLQASGWIAPRGVLMHTVESHVIIIVPDSQLSDFSALPLEREALLPIKRTKQPRLPLALPASKKALVSKQELVNRLSTSEYYTFLSQLSGAEPATIAGAQVTIATRYTLANNNDDAARFIRQTLNGYGYAETIFQPFDFRGKTTNNIIAIKRGSTKPDEIVVVCAHMDSISETSATVAPGAVDNGSGSAGVLQVAKAFANVTTERTIYFALWTAEEQGLIGSFYFVDQAVDEGLNIVAALNMDMIAYSNVYYGTMLESEEEFDDLLDIFESNIQEVSSNLTFFRKYGAGGSDHVPFIRAGIPGLLAIEEDRTNYYAYHRTTDSIANVNRNQAVDIARAAAGTLFDLVGVL